VVERRASRVVRGSRGGGGSVGWFGDGFSKLYSCFPIPSATGRSWDFWELGFFGGGRTNQNAPDSGSGEKLRVGEGRRGRGGLNGGDAVG
jgi:hypothetical protein